MPVSFLSQEDKKRLESFPRDITDQDAATYFTMSQADKEQIPYTSQDRNRLGFALQLCTLRYLGFYPADLNTVPKSIVQVLADQVQADSGSLGSYGQRLQTVHDHQQRIETYLGYSNITVSILDDLAEWLCERPSPKGEGFGGQNALSNEFDCGSPHGRFPALAITNSVSPWKEFAA